MEVELRPETVCCVREKMSSRPEDVVSVLEEATFEASKTIKCATPNDANYWNILSMVYGQQANFVEDAQHPMHGKPQIYGLSFPQSQLSVNRHGFTGSYVEGSRVIVHVAGLVDWSEKRKDGFQRISDYFEMRHATFISKLKRHAPKAFSIYTELMFDEGEKARHDLLMGYQKTNFVVGKIMEVLYTPSKIQELKAEFHRLRQRPGQSFETFNTLYEAKRSMLNKLGSTTSPLEAKWQLVHALNEEYQTWSIGMSWADKTYHQTKEVLRAYDQRAVKTKRQRQNTEGPKERRYFKRVNFGRKSQNGSFTGNANAWKKQGQSRQVGQKIACWNCGTPGHKSPDCKKPKANPPNPFRPKTNSAMPVAAVEESEQEDVETSEMIEITREEALNTDESVFQLESDLVTE